MRLAGVRFLTALAIVAACALAISRGWEIVRFSIADEALDTDDDRAEALRPWIAVPGLAFLARESSLTGLDAPDDDEGALKLHDDLVELLSVKPLSANYWLSLSRMRVAARQDSSKIAETLAFSALIGANEGYLMPDRGIFGVSQWEVLPPEARKRTATDLVATNLSDRVKARLRRVLSAKTEEIRKDIRTALQAEGFSPKGLVDIGL